MRAPMFFQDASDLSLQFHPLHFAIRDAPQNRVHPREVRPEVRVRLAQTDNLTKEAAHRDLDVL